jgi:hypothetical protein
LQRENPLLDRISGNESVNEDRIDLPDSVRSVSRLVLHRRIPPRVEDIDVVSGRKV